MNTQLLTALGLIGAFIGGRLVSFGDAYVQDIFDRQKELREKLTKPYHMISDLIADAQGDYYKIPPTPEANKRARKIAAFIESLGKRNLAIDVREFVRYWNQQSVKGQYISGATEIDIMILEAETRVKLDNLADFMMEELAKDYTVFPNLLLKIKRVWALRIVPIFKRQQSSK